MIPKNVREGAEPQNLGTGETRAFTISANGKAFRTLIDGLYSNKVRAVIRELCSNAQDSHIAAGNAAPFKVSIPTNLDPIFSVRDYGTSLSHEDVMGLYTTIFQSSKEGTNEQTGMLGLGSKSPFAYTDSFSVTTYTGQIVEMQGNRVLCPRQGEKRVYLAHLAHDGVPSLTHVSTEPSSEPRGLEVQFAANRDDMREFQREMQFVAMGYKVLPEVIGMEIKCAPPRLSGDNWAIYPNGSFGGDMRSNRYIRQGSALYPTNKPFPHVGFGWITIVDIPIGTAEVTASREALSYDDDTTKAISGVHEAAYIELTAQIDAKIAAAKTRVDKAKVYSQYNGILDNIKGSTFVSLLDKGGKYRLDGTDTVRKPGDVIERADFYKKSEQTYHGGNRHVSSVEYKLLSRVVLLVDDTENKVVRRTKRVRQFADSHNRMVYIIEMGNLQDRSNAIAWIKECFELRDDQIMLVSNLPDCPPDPSTVKRAPSMKRLLNPGQHWMLRNNGIVESDIYGCSIRGIGNWPTQMEKVMNMVSHRAEWGDVFWVTTKQMEKFQMKGLLPDTKRLDVVVKAKMDSLVAKAPLDEAATFNALRSVVGQYNSALPVVMSNFFPSIKITSDRAAQVTRLASLANLDLQSRPIVAKIEAQLNELVKQYPLLFQRSERSHYEQYVKAVKATINN